MGGERGVGGGAALLAVKLIVVMGDADGAAADEGLGGREGSLRG